MTRDEMRKLLEDQPWPNKPPKIETLRKALHQLLEETEPKVSPIPSGMIHKSGVCQCPIEDWRDIPDGPFCLVCGRPMPWTPAPSKGEDDAAKD